MANALPMIPFDNFHMGGLADSKWSGVVSSVYRMTGFNPHQVPGLLRVAQALEKISSNIVDEFVKSRMASTNGNQYWGSAASGKIWMRDGDTGTVSLVFTVTASLGESKILGMIEYQSHFYIATQNKLHRIPVALAKTAGDWTTNFVSNWAEFENGDNLYHPMREQNLVLYIGDGNLLAQVDAGTFSPAALDISNPLRIKSLGKIYTDLLIGTFVSDNVTKTQLFRWNTSSETFQVSNEIDEPGINAFLPTDKFVYVSAGVSGRIYVYDYANNRLQSYKTIMGEYGPDSFNTVYPEAVATLNGIALFGVSNAMGDPSDEGVFAIGHYSENYPYIMDMPYPISTRDVIAGITEFVLTGVEIGTVLVAGFDVFVSWRRTNAGIVETGIDKVNYAKKLDGAYLISRIMSSDRTKFTNFNQFKVAYASLPTGTAIQISHSPNYKPFIIDLVKNDTDRNLVYADLSRTEATTMQIKLKMTTINNLGPEIEGAGVEII